MSYVSLKTKFVEDFLQRLDKMGMQHSVEGRVPLVDPRLVEWSFSVPQTVKVGSFQQKLLFRNAVEPVLPRFILDRPKQGFSPPATAWAEALLERRGHGVARELVDTGLIRPDVDRALRREGGSWAAWTLGTLCEWIEEMRSPSAVAA